MKARTRTIDVYSRLGRISGARFFSLQKSPEGNQKPPEEMELIDYTGELNDFADMAGLTENLDLVISVDTSIAHLAGALGKPVWVLIPHRSDFRWLMDREDSPWYPTMRLFRQKRGGNWDEVAERIGRALETRVGEMG
jgi:ADP-heptose:LPS heptosyltransferase